MSIQQFRNDLPSNDTKSLIFKLKPAETENDTPRTPTRPMSLSCGKGDILPRLSGGIHGERETETSLGQKGMKMEMSHVISHAPSSQFPGCAHQPTRCT